MDIIKTILRLSFFILGCIMLMLALLVSQIGFTDCVWFFGFSVFFFLLGYFYTSKVSKALFRKLKKIYKKTFKKVFKKLPGCKAKIKDTWIEFKTQKISYDIKTKQIKLNGKVFDFKQVSSLDIMDNSKKVTLKEFNGSKTHKKPEIKIGVKVNKVTYRHFKYDDSKKAIKQLANDYKMLKSALKISNKNKTKKK